MQLLAAASRLRALRPTSRMQWLLLLVLGTNVVLILVGLIRVPTALGAALSAPVSHPEGLSSLLGALGIQVVVAVLALVGPLSFAKYPRAMGISLACGALFAATYLVFLASDFSIIQLGINDGPAMLYALFFGVAVLAGAAAGARSQRLRDGIVAAIWALLIGTAIWSVGLLLMDYTLWGSPHWYQFEVQDGAVNDFRQSGGTDLAAFLLQDVQGALFWHQILSAVVGILGGLLGSGIVLGTGTLWQLLRRLTPSRV